MATVIDRHSQPTWRDFLELTKPKVVVLMLITSLIGMLLATKAPLDGFVPWQVLIFGNLGIGLCAGAAAAVNHVVDRRIDSIMARTHKRPLAEGRVSPSMALGFALLLALAGMAVLLAFTNPLTAWLTLASLLGYAALYTGFLKRATPQNIVIGGLAGAAPPLLGWQGFHRRRHDHVGGAVPISSSIVASVVARPLRLVLVPFLGDRDAAEHHMVDPAFVHRLQQARHAFAFLEEIHVVHVSVAVAIIPGMGQGCHQGQGEQCRKQGTRTGASHGIPPDRPE